MTEEETILGIPIGVIKSRRNLIGTWRHFGREHEMPCKTRQQFDAMGVSDLEVAGYILDCQSVQERDGAIKAADEALSKQTHRTFIEDRKEARRKGLGEHQKLYEEYLEDFDAPTKADKGTLWTLSGIDLALRKNLGAQYVWYEKTDAGAIQNKKLLSDEVARLSSEFRQLQKMLGIDKPTREGKDSAESAMEYIRRIVEGAREFVDEQITQMVHCNILIREDIDHFPELYTKLIKQCPRCGDMIEIEYGERKE